MSITVEVARRPRTAGLVAIAIILLAMAGSVWGQPARHDPDLAVWHLIIPTWVRSAMWGAAGLAAVVGAIWPRWETVAYRLSTIMPMERALSYGWSWVVWVMPGPPAGDPLGVFHAAFWSGLAFVIVWASGLTQWRPRDV